VLNFWQFVLTLDNEMQSKMISFVTGTARVPMNGFEYLEGSQGSVASVLLALFLVVVWGLQLVACRPHGTSRQPSVHSVGWQCMVRAKVRCWCLSFNSSCFLPSFHVGLWNCWMFDCEMLDCWIVGCWMLDVGL
jgi:hypothetical protein